MWSVVTATPCTSLVPWLIDNAQLVNALVEVVTLPVCVCGWHFFAIHLNTLFLMGRV